MILTLIEVALRALIVAVAVWGGLRILGVRDVLAQKAAWGLVLAAALLMPVVLPLAMRWHILPSVSLPAVPWPAAVDRAVTPAPGTPAAPAAARVETRAADTALPPAYAIHRHPSRIVATAAPTPAAVSVSEHVSAPATTETRTIIQTPPPLDRHPAEPAGSIFPSLTSMALLVYFTGCALLLLRLIYGLTSAVSLWFDAEPVELAEIEGMRLRSSRAIASPVTIGSGVVLPSSYDEWDAEKLRIVLAHERSHIRQGDFYLQLLAGLYAALFWFSPLGWWLKRKLSDLGEAISDRAGLEEAASRSSYAQLLLEFAAAPRPTLMGVAMARTSSLAGRIERLLNDSHFRQAFSWSPRRAVAAVLLVPAAFFAATALVHVEAAGAHQAASATPAAVQPTQPAQPAAESQPAAEPQAAPEPLMGQARPDNDVTESPVAPAIAPIAPMAPNAPLTLTIPAGPRVAPVAPVMPVMPPAALARLYSLDKLGRGLTIGPCQSLTITPLRQAQAALAQLDAQARANANTDIWTRNGRHYTLRSGSGNGYAYSFRNDDDDSYALVTGPVGNVRFSGDWMDGRQHEIEKASKAAHGKFLWFEHDDKSYVIDDPSIISSIEEMYKPMDELSRKQEELGKQQEELGKQQEELGRKQEQASVPTPDISKEIAELNAALAKLQSKKGSTMTQEDLSDLQEKIGDLQGRIGDIQGKIGDIQGKLGEQQGELGEKQGKLGDEQGRLGDQQGRLAEDADRKVHSIINDSLKNGKARQVE